MTVVVHGLRELEGAFSEAGGQLKRGLNRNLQHAAEPVARTAEGLAQTRVRNMTSDWAQMRVGVTSTLVYVAPVKRGIKGRGDDPRRRSAPTKTGGPAFADLLMNRAMEPALARHENQIVGEVEEILDRATEEFNRGG